MKDVLLGVINIDVFDFYLCVIVAKSRSTEDKDTHEIVYGNAKMSE